MVLVGIRGMFSTFSAKLRPISWNEPTSPPTSSGGGLPYLPRPSQTFPDQLTIQLSVIVEVQQESRHPDSGASWTPRPRIILSGGQWSGASQHRMTNMALHHHRPSRFPLHLSPETSFSSILPHSQTFPVTQGRFTQEPRGRERKKFSQSQWLRLRRRSTLTSHQVFSKSKGGKVRWIAYVAPKALVFGTLQELRQAYLKEVGVKHYLGLQHKIDQ